MDRLDSQSNKSVTVRAVATGLLLVVVVSLFATYAEYMAHGYRMQMGHMPMALLIPFSILVFGVNRIVRMIRPGAALTPRELVVVFIMVDCIDDADYSPDLTSGVCAGGS